MAIGVGGRLMSPNGRVTNLHLYDSHNHLFMTGFYLPRKFPSAPGFRMLAGLGPEDNRTPDDDSVGQMLMAMAKERSATRLRGTGRDTEEAGLQTWVFSPSPRHLGRLEDWFAGALPDSRYRVLVHRTPCQYAGRRLPVLWDDVYDELYALNPPTLRSYPPSPRALRSGVTVLEEGLGSYSRGTEAAITWADGLGHPYTLVV